MNVIRWKSPGAETGSHGFSRGSHVAGGGVSCIDLDELFENIAGDLVFRREAGLLLGADGTGRQHRNGARERKNKFIHRWGIINSSQQNSSETSQIPYNWKYGSRLGKQVSGGTDGKCERQPGTRIKESAY